MIDINNFQFFHKKLIVDWRCTSSKKEKKDNSPSENRSYPILPHVITTPTNEEEINRRFISSSEKYYYISLMCGRVDVLSK